MTPRELVMERLRLRTHPFAPNIAKDGTAFANDPLTGPLDPIADPRLLAYYFDLYDWSSSPMLKGLSATGLQKFPTREDLSEDGPLLVIVSGTGRSGRGSLVNLILHTIQLTRGAKPIVIPVKFNGTDLAQSVRQLGTGFIYAYTKEEKKPTRDQLQAIFDRETKTKTVDGEAYYSSLFVGLGTDVRESCTRPIVFSVSGGDRYDLWSCLYHSSAPLTNYLIVETPKLADAKTCHTLMSGKGNNVVHISARKLDFDRAQNYITGRLVDERPPAAPAADALAPFTPKAIKILFEPGTGSGGVAVSQAIGWLRKTLGRVLQEHIDELAARVTAKGPAVLDAMSADELVITDTKMWKIRQQMNGGD